jgi:E3 ubiquitin-protein ligase SHPRH
MVYEYEIPSRISELEAESSIAEQEVKRTMGTLKYLKGLEKMNNKDSYTPHDSDRVNTDDSFCPVCHDPLVDEMAMLPCGHLLCLQCNVAITEKESRGKQEKVIKCPSCRMASSACETAVVTKAASPTLPTHAESWAGESSIQVKGSFGTKIEAVVRRIKALLLSHPDDRIIVFSTWKDSLDIAAHAFVTNGIEHLHPRNAKSFDAAIQAFRGDSNSARVLLLLVKQGGNGLNLQQAQHVIFVEPILDPGEEAQAIGRIDRMGQSKSTFVHKFLIRSSVEENVERISDHKRLYESGKKRHSKSHHLSVSEVTALLQ